MMIFNVLKGQEIDSNQSRAVGRTVSGPFQESLTIGDLWTATKPNSGHSGADFDLP